MVNLAMRRPSGAEAAELSTDVEALQ